MGFYITRYGTGAFLFTGHNVSIPTGLVPAINNRKQIIQICHDATAL